MVENGAQVVPALERQSFDIVFLDIEMPEVDGYQAAARVREWELAHDCRRPLIALTAHAQAEHRRKAEVAGFDDHIAKPITTDALARCLRKWVQQEGGSAPVVSRRKAKDDSRPSSLVSRLSSLAGAGPPQVKGLLEPVAMSSYHPR